MAIYLNNDYVIKVKRLISEQKELKDVLEELQRINIAINECFYANNTYDAIRLDAELREKYPTIDLMLNVAEIIPKIHEKQCDRISVPDSNEISALKQDRCGILCHVMIKKESQVRLKNALKR